MPAFHLEDSLFAHLVAEYEKQRSQFVCPCCHSDQITIDSRETLFCPKCQKSFQADALLKEQLVYSELLLSSGLQNLLIPEKEREASLLLRKAGASFRKKSKTCGKKARLGQYISNLAKTYLYRRQGKWAKAQESFIDSTYFAQKLSPSFFHLLYLASLQESLALQELCERDPSDAADLFYRAQKTLEKAHEYASKKDLDWLEKKEIELLLMSAWADAMLYSRKDKAWKWLEKALEKTEAFYNPERALYPLLLKDERVRRLFQTPSCSEKKQALKKEQDYSSGLEAIYLLYWKILLKKNDPALSDFEEIFLLQTVLAEYYLQRNESAKAKDIFESFSLLKESVLYQKAIQQESQQDLAAFDAWYLEGEKDFEKQVENVQNGSKQKVELVLSGVKECALIEEAGELLDQVSVFADKKLERKEYEPVFERLNEILLELLNTWPFSFYGLDTFRDFALCRYFWGVAELRWKRGSKARDQFKFAQSLEAFMNRLYSQQALDYAQELSGPISLGLMLAYGLLKDIEKYEACKKIVKRKLGSKALKNLKEFSPYREGK